MHPICYSADIVLSHIPPPKKKQKFAISLTGDINPQSSNWNNGKLNTQPFYSSLDFVRDNPGELVREGTFRHLLDFLVHPTIFMPDALPATSLPGLGQAPNMLACIPGGLVQ